MAGTANRSPTALAQLRRATRTLKNRLIERALLYLLLSVGGLVVALPFLWMVSSSLKSATEIFLFPPRLLPEAFRYTNYHDALTAVPFLRYFRNSVLVSSLVVVGTVVSSSFVAYGFAYLHGWGRNALFAVVLATMMLPNQVTLVPQFLLFSKLNWVNTFAPLTVPYFFGGAFNIFLFRQFFLGIPRDYLDASRVDGATHFGTYLRIVMPMSRPVTATVAVLALFWSWNEFLLPLVYLNSERLYTVPLGLAAFQQAYASQTPWHWLMAASVVAVLPLIVLFFFAQRIFIQGVVVTGLKG